MTDQQQRFVDEYVIDCKGSKAAIRAGYSKATAKEMAYELKQNPEIAAAIAQRLKERQMTAEEAAKRVSDNAATRLNDYMKPTKVHEMVWVRRKLSDLIKEQKLLIERKQKFFDRWTGGVFKDASDWNEDEDESDKKGKKKKSLLDEFFEQQQIRKMELLEMEIELEQNPKAYRDVREMQIIEKVEIDLIGIAKAQGKGAVKKFGFNEHGPQIEMYDASAALRDILQMHGKLVQKHEHSGEFVAVDTSNLSPEELDAMLELAIKIVK